MAAEGDLRAVLSAQGAVRQRHLDERRRAVGREAAGERGSTSYTYPDWEWVNGVAIIGPDGRVDPVRRVLTFTSAPLENDLEVTGPIVLKLFASSTAIDTQFIVKLSDQQPQDDAARKAGEQPAFTPVSKGWLKASHREKDEKRSTPERPFYTHTNPQPLTPGEIYAFDIEVLPISYVFKKGHRIRLELANGDSPRDRRRVLASLSSDADGHRHHPPRRRARLVHPAAGGRLARRDAMTLPRRRLLQSGRGRRSPLPALPRIARAQAYPSQARSP